MNVLYNIYIYKYIIYLYPETGHKSRNRSQIQKPVTNPETGDLIFIAKKKGFFNYLIQLIYILTIHTLLPSHLPTLFPQKNSIVLLDSIHLPTTSCSSSYMIPVNLPFKYFLPS